MLLSLCLLLAGDALAVPTQVGHQGRLLSSGSPLEGDYEVTFTVHDAAIGGGAVWSETLTLTLSDGYYAAALGSDAGNPLDDTVFDGGDLFLGVSVDGGAELSPRQQVNSAPFAVRAGVATDVAGGTVDASEVLVDGVAVIDSTGEWIGPAVSWLDLDDVPAELSDGDDVLTEAEVDAMVADNGYATGAVFSGSFTDLSDVPAGLSDGDDDRFAEVSCVFDGEVLVWDEVLADWVCDAPITGDDVLDAIAAGPVELAVGSTLDGRPLAARGWVDSADFAAFQDAIDATPAGGALVVTEVREITAAHAVPAGVHLVFAPGARLDVAAGATLDIQGLLDAPEAHVFGGDGPVTIAASAAREVRLRWFGPAADDVTDDTAVFQRAIDTGHPVIGVPEGDFRVDSITLRSELHLVADAPRRARLLRIPGGTEVMMQTGGEIISELRLEGLVLDGDADTDPYLLELKNGSNQITLEENTFIGAHGVRAASFDGSVRFTHDVRVLRNRFEGETTGGSALALYHCSDILVEDNDFVESANFNITIGTYGDVVRDFIIVNNRFTGVDATNISVRGTGDMIAENVVISGNTFYDHGYSEHKSAILVGQHISTTGSAVWRNVTISDNVMTAGNAHGWGIIVGEGDAGLVTMENVTITGNAFDGADVDGTVASTSGSVGIWIMRSLQGVTVTGNSLRNCGRAGIGVSESTEVTIAGNTIVNAAVNNLDDSSAAIWMSHSLTQRASITGNTILNAGNETSPHVAGVGLERYEGQRDIVIANNVIIDDRETPLMQFGVRIGWDTNHALQPHAITVVGNHIRGAAQASIYNGAQARDKSYLIRDNQIAEGIIQTLEDAAEPDVRAGRLFQTGAPPRSPTSSTATSARPSCCAPPRPSTSWPGATSSWPGPPTST